MLEKQGIRKDIQSQGLARPVRFSRKANEDSGFRADIERLGRDICLQVAAFSKLRPDQSLQVVVVAVVL